MSAHTAKGKRTLRTDLPVDVWDRLADEAAAHGVPVGRYLHDLIVARDERRQSRVSRNGASPSTGPSNRKADTP